MTSFEPKIRSLYVEAFRGFRDARKFDLSADSVIVTGPNGTGKTSFFDALQWGLVGRIERLEELRSRRNVEHIVNSYRLGQKSTVEIGLTLPSGNVTVRRTGDQRGSTLELRREGSVPVFGEEAEGFLRELIIPEAETSLNSTLSTSGLMQQDVMRRVLEAKPADRYKQMSVVLGLGELEDFEDATKLLAKQAQERSKSAQANFNLSAEALRQSEARLEAARTRLAMRAQVATVRDEVVALLRATPAGVFLDEGTLRLRNQREARSLALELGDAARFVDATLASFTNFLDMRAALPEEVDERQLLFLEQRSAEADVNLRLVSDSKDATSERYETAKRVAAEMAQISALAIPLLGEECPVCGQDIDRAQVERALRVRSIESRTIVELRQQFEGAQGDLRDAEHLASEARRSLDTARSTIESWQRVRDIERTVGASITSLTERVGVVTFDQFDFDSFSHAAHEVLTYLNRARRALLDLVEVFDRQADQGVVDRAEAEVRTLRAAMHTAEERAEAESDRCDELQVLADETLEARVEVTEARFRSIQPLVANIFQRLDPHPSFKAVEFELDTYYRKGTTSPLVIDPVENVSADPLLVFSTSQANIVALAYFVAMSLALGDRGLPFLLLDDPVQSMDDVNVLGFTDLCRHIRTRRQLIVSTHDRRFASLLERKLAPRSEGVSTRIIRFTGWDRSGPMVSERLVAPQLVDDPIRLVRQAG